MSQTYMGRDRRMAGKCPWAICWPNRQKSRVRIEKSVDELNVEGDLKNLVNLRRKFNETK